MDGAQVREVAVVRDKRPVSTGLQTMHIALRIRGVAIMTELAGCCPVPGGSDLQDDMAAVIPGLPTA